MRQIFACVAAAAFLFLSWSAQSASQPAKKAPARKTAARKTVARKGTGRTATRKKAPAKAATWRTRQAAPTADRYREIQQALAAKGYLKPEDATGVWNQNSVEALKRFQSEQNIESTGKINSLSLIALGLGPKHEAAAKPAATGQPPVPEAAPDHNR